jgi:hypothetical protein
VIGSRALAFRVALILLSLLFAAALGEAGLRVWYRDGGSRTLGGPGGYSFEHDTIDGELRGPRNLEQKRPGVPRIMVIGDSITYGQGVRDWRQTWPELLVQELERRGRPHERAVFAWPGHDMAQHVEAIRRWGSRVDPDILIYQWYVNDLEVLSHRPNATRAWQREPWHSTWRQWSYLYFSLDYYLAKVLPPPERTYSDYLLTDFVPGTLEWTEFERQFHEFGVRAKRIAPRRVMALYPQVPFRGAYPLQPIHDRMRELAGPHTLEIPPQAWTRSGGTLVADPEAPFKQVFTVSQENAPAAIMTADYVFEPSPLTVVLNIQATAEQSTPVVLLQAVDAETNLVLVEASVDVPAASREARPVAVSVTIPGEGVRPVRLRVQSSSGPRWMLESIRIAVDYGFETVDLTTPLNTFDTHASAFDAHPNEAAQRVIAREICEALLDRPSS